MKSIHHLRCEIKQNDDGCFSLYCSKHLCLCQCPVGNTNKALDIIDNTGHFHVCFSIDVYETYRKMNVKFKRARHVHHPITLASFDRSGCHLEWANSCANPNHSPIFSQIGKEMPEKSLIYWIFWNLFHSSQNQRFIRHFFTDLAENWWMIRVWA